MIQTSASKKGTRRQSPDTTLAIRRVSRGVGHTPRSARPMRSPETLAQWTAEILPAGVRTSAPQAARRAGSQLLRALLLGYTTCLSQLARQVERRGIAKQRRQYLSR